MTEDPIIDWLLEGDVSIQYQVYRDLFKTERSDLRNRISNEGWGAQFLANRNSKGHWGIDFYQPKWTSTHYTLLDLKNLAISNENRTIRPVVQHIVQTRKAPDGGINPAKTIAKSDMCINGMFLNYASYFGIDQNNLKSVVDIILEEQMNDGGFNCQLTRKGAVHSSLHTTLSVVEGIDEYAKNNYTYRITELKKAESEAREFILEHKLYQSHRTGKIISDSFLKLSYPCRWRYDILRCLDYFQFAKVPFDNRMNDAIEVLIKKRKPDFTWPLQAKHIGKTHFDMEIAGKSSRWNTLRAIRVLRYFGFND
jgi:hypothetical protein